METSKKYLNQIPRKGNNTVTTWANNAFGSISYTDDSHYRFIKYEVDENGEILNINNSNDKRKQCPIVASGIIAYWFLHSCANSEPLQIFNGYLSNCKKRIEKENKKEFIFNMPESIILIKHLQQEFNKLEESSQLFDYISDTDIEEIKKIAKGYIQFVSKNINFEQITDLSKDKLLTLLYISNYPEKDVECPYFMSINIFENACSNIGKDFLYIADTCDGYTVSIKEEGLGIIESLLESNDTEDNTKIKPTNEKSPTSTTTITKGKEDIFLINILSLCKHNVFSNAGGSVIDEKKLLENFGKFFNLDLNEIKNTIDSKYISLTEELLPLFYNDSTEAIVYIKNIEKITDNTEKAKYTANLVNTKIISDESCKTLLWNILTKYRLYDKGYENWRKAITDFLK